MAPWSTGLCTPSALLCSHRIAYSSHVYPSPHRQGLGLIESSGGLQIRDASRLLEYRYWHTTRSCNTSWHCSLLYPSLAVVSVCVARIAAFPYSFHAPSYSYCARVPAQYSSTRTVGYAAFSPIHHPSHINLHRQGSKPHLHGLALSPSPCSIG